MTTLPQSISRALVDMGTSFQQRTVSDRARAISEHYRERRTSSDVIRASADAYAYAVSRMPATYAALSYALRELRARAPTFAPAHLLDIGCGPGTAALAAKEELGVDRGILVDHNPEFLALAGQLAAEVGFAPSMVRSDLSGFHPELPADLVICGYSLTELDGETAEAVIHRLWANAAGALVIVEPGRPADYRRLMNWRRTLIGLGASILAPCPQQNECPLLADDWCHFSVRLARSKAHRAAKSAQLGYEDEKFSYIIATRAGLGDPAGSRVLRRPKQSKVGVQLTLCGPDGVGVSDVSRREKRQHGLARRLDWGDGLDVDALTVVDPIAGHARGE